jgi:signal transduction histidine kinase
MLAGGLPRSRSGFLAVLLVLSGGLVGVSLLQLRREAELGRLRADFISSVSHELRTPLAQIRMFAETLLLRRVRSEYEQQRSLEIIDQEARRLTHLVDNVLQFSRAERRVTTLSLEPVDLADSLTETVEVFTPLAEAADVRVELAVEEGITVAADRNALRQMLLNLLDNAVKYGPPGQSVVVGCGRAGKPVRFWVDDEGTGIAPSDRRRIFRPYYRRKRDARSAVAGSGIGLAVVRELASLHGGRVWVEDGTGGGARFVVELPVQVARSGAPASAPRADAGRRAEPGDGAGGEGEPAVGAAAVAPGASTTS